MSATSAPRSQSAASLVPPSALTLRDLGQALRIRQWPKNGLVFIPLAFTLNLQDAPLVARTCAAGALFCILSSAGYLANDVADVAADRQHPRKRLRPIAAGRLSPRTALAVSLILAILGTAAAWLTAPALGVLAVSYLLLTATYTVWLKHVVLLDVFAIAAGFVLRAVAGAVVINVPTSPWLFIATMLGALLLALGKRRSEVQALGSFGVHYRRNLESYSLDLLDQLILIVSSAALMTYGLYTFSAENLPRNHSMMLTIPVVLYGLFRYLFLIRVGEMAGTPEELLFRDRPLLAVVITWIALAVGILYLNAGS